MSFELPGQFAQFGEALVGEDLTFYFVLERLGGKAGCIGLKGRDRFLFVHDRYCFLMIIAFSIYIVHDTKVQLYFYIASDISKNFHFF